LATLAGGDSFAAVVRADRALLRYRRGDYEGAELLAHEALDAAPARAHNVLGLVALGRGLLDASLAEFELARVSAWGEQFTDVWVAAGQNASRALQALGRLDDALSMAEMTLREAQRDSDLQRVAAVTSQVADVLHALGRGDEAQELQREATELFVQVALPSQRPAVWLAADW
jgi:tetratricopeptide (TPR) repeat protein